MEISKEIGKGAYGKVFTLKDNEDYVLKKINYMDPDTIRSILLEIIIMYSIDHPNIMKCKGWNLSKISMEFYMVKYPISLMKYLQLNQASKYHINTKTINSMLMNILNGIDYIHVNGILHLDISDDNIMLDNNLNCVITDFGLSDIEYKKDDFKSNIKQKFPVIKNPFAPPEVLEETFYNSKADIWSFGVLMAKIINYGYIFLNIKERNNQLKYINTFLSKNNEDKKKFIENYISPRCIDYDSLYVVSDELTQTHIDILLSIFTKNIDDRPTAREIMRYLNFYEWVSCSNDFINLEHIDRLRSYFITTLNNDKEGKDICKITKKINESLSSVYVK